MNSGVRVWIATDGDGIQWIATREKPKLIYDGCRFDMREPFDTFQQRHGINVPPGECREFIIVPAESTQAEPQPVAVPPLASEWYLTVATAAMQALIAKIPLFDRHGEHGVSAPSVEEIHQVRRDVSESAFDYADAMRDELVKREAAARIEGGDDA